MSSKIPASPASEIDRIIRLAWHDRTSFEAIREETGLDEDAVIRVMRSELKPRSFRLWRKRVSGRVTKHRKRFKRQRELMKVTDAL